MADKETTYDLACECARQHRYDESIALFRQLLQDNPEEDSLRLALAWTCRDAGRPDEALEIFHQLLQTELSRRVFTGFAFDELVRIYTEKGDFENLVTVCRQVAEAQSEDFSIAFTLGQAYLKAHRPSEAIEVFEKLCRLEPDATLYFLALGDALIASGAFGQAEDAYEQAIATDPDGADGYCFRLGQTLLQAGVNERALEAFDRAIQKNPACALYYCGLGDACLALGQMTEAEAAYEEAVRISPQDGASFYNRFGHALSASGRHTEAVRIFQKAVAADPTNPLLQFYLSQARTKAVSG